MVTSGSQLLSLCAQTLYDGIMHTSVQSAKIWHPELLKCILKKRCVWGGEPRHGGAAFNPSSWEAKIGESLGIQSQPGQ